MGLKPKKITDFSTIHEIKTEKNKPFLVSLTKMANIVNMKKYRM